MNIKKGFTLVELAVSLVIIALLIAGISAGHVLIEQTKMRQIVSEANKINGALNNFHAKFNHLPGDFPDASLIFSGTGNGDGDGVISRIADSSGAGASEAGRVFEQLSLAKMYPGNFTPGNILANNFIPNEDMTPQGPFGGYFLVTGCTFKGNCATSFNFIGGTSVNVVRFGKITTDLVNFNTTMGEGVLTVDEMILFDKKFDDGLARNGKITGHNSTIAADFVSEGCLTFSSGTTHDPALFAGGASYNTGSDFMCGLSFNTSF